ncbi:MAG: hypothetical protein R3Y61_05090 [Rikenellaceae bacterium]
MKKILFLLSALVLGACSSSYDSNKYLGELPYVYYQRTQAMEELALSVQSRKIDLEDAMKKEEEIRKTYTEDAQKAFEAVKGQDVFLNWADGFEGRNVEIASAKITNISPESGALTVNVMFKATKDHVVGKDKFRYIPANKDGQARPDQQFSPYANSALMTGKSIPYGKEIKAGEYTCEEGTNLMLYLDSYDYRDFIMIMLVNRD